MPTMPSKGRPKPHTAPGPGMTGPRSTGRLQRAIDATVRRELTAALKESKGNVTHAARLLGVSRIALRARMNKLGIG